MSLFFSYLLWRSICGVMEIRQRRRVIAVFVNNQHDIKRRGQYFDTKLTENTFLSVKKTVTAGTSEAEA